MDFFFKKVQCLDWVFYDDPCRCGGFKVFFCWFTPIIKAAYITIQGFNRSLVIWGDGMKWYNSTDDTGVESTDRRYLLLNTFDWLHVDKNNIQFFQTLRIHGTGIFTYISHKNPPNVGKVSQFFTLRVSQGEFKPQRNLGFPSTCTASNSLKRVWRCTYDIMLVHLHISMIKHIRIPQPYMCIYRCTYSTYIHIDTHTHTFLLQFHFGYKEVSRHWPSLTLPLFFLCLWPEAKPYVFRVLSTSSSFARTMRSRSLNAIYELVDHCPSFPRPTMWTWDLTRNCGWFDLYGGVGFCQVQAIQIVDG